MESPVIIVIAALFLAFLVSANGAVTVRTTITTTATSTEDAEVGRETKEYCRDERETAMGMRECMMYVSEGGVALRMVVVEENPGQQMLLQQCCQKLGNVPEHCRCGVIDEMMKMMMKQQFKNLPKMCKMEPQVC